MVTVLPSSSVTDIGKAEVGEGEAVFDGLAEAEGEGVGEADSLLFEL
jgi:hypothetical protein